MSLSDAKALQATIDAMRDEIAEHGDAVLQLTAELIDDDITRLVDTALTPAPRHAPAAARDLAEMTLVALMDAAESRQGRYGLTGTLNTVLAMIPLPEPTSPYGHLQWFAAVGQLVRTHSLRPAT